MGSIKSSSREQNHSRVWEKMRELKLSTDVYFIRCSVEPYNGHITLTVENVVSVLSLGFIMLKNYQFSGKMFLFDHITLSWVFVVIYFTFLTIMGQIDTH